MLVVEILIVAIYLFIIWNIWQNLQGHTRSANEKKCREIQQEIGREI